MPVPPRPNLHPTSNRNLDVRNIILHGRLHRLHSFLPPRIHRHVLCRTLPAIILQPVSYPSYHRYILKYILPGFRVVAVAVILQAFVGLFKKITNQRVMIGIVFCCAAVYYFEPTTAVILIEFAIGGVLGYFYYQVPDS
jgi:chromate transport protein ChrA